MSSRTNCRDHCPASSVDDFIIESLWSFMKPYLNALKPAMLARSNDVGAPKSSFSSTEFGESSLLNGESGLLSVTEHRAPAGR